MEQNLERTLSQQLFEIAEGRIDNLDEEILKSWRAKYLAFIENKKKITQEEIREFLTPYILEIYNIFSNYEPGNISNEDITYDLVFYNLINHKLQQSFTTTLILDRASNFITIGRASFNDIYSPERFPDYISRLHLLIIRLPNSFLIFDPFSLTGSEPIDINNINYKQIIENQEKKIKSTKPMFMPLSTAQYIRIGAGAMGIFPRQQNRYDQTRTCTVCLTSFPDCMLSCGHTCLCTSCVINIKECPLCRKEKIFNTFAKSNTTFYLEPSQNK